MDEHLCCLRWLVTNGDRHDSDCVDRPPARAISDRRIVLVAQKERDAKHWCVEHLDDLRELNGGGAPRRVQIATRPDHLRGLGQEVPILVPDELLAGMEPTLGEMLRFLEASGANLTTLEKLLEAVRC